MLPGAAPLLPGPIPAPTDGNATPPIVNPAPDRDVLPLSLIHPVRRPELHMAIPEEIGQVSSRGDMDGIRLGDKRTCNFLPCDAIAGSYRG